MCYVCTFQLSNPGRVLLLTLQSKNIQKVCNYLCMYGYVCFNSLSIACTVKSVSTVDAAVQANYLAVAEGSF